MSSNIKLEPLALEEEEEVVVVGLGIWGDGDRPGGRGTEICRTAHHTMILHKHWFALRVSILPFTCCSLEVFCVAAELETFLALLLAFGSSLALAVACLEEEGSALPPLNRYCFLSYLALMNCSTALKVGGNRDRSGRLQKLDWG